MPRVIQWFVHSWLALSLAGASGSEGWAQAPSTAAVPTKAEEVPLRVTPVPAELKLDGFYKKHVSANGYPIVSSEKVSDYALLEAGYLVNLMLAQRPDVRAAMVRSGSHMAIMAYNEFTTDIPEHKALKPKEYWDRRARGLGGSETDPVCSCAEENLLAYPGDPYSTECILIHEFAHNIHLRGVLQIDPTFDERLKKAYTEALQKGLWKGKYASTNDREYFAEGVQSWFDNNRPADHDHNYVHTRKQLKEYDPGLAALCEEIFGETKLAYTYPATRLQGHLAGFDPTRAPRFQWPSHLEKIGEAIRRDALAKRPGGAENGANGKYETRLIEGWTVRVRRDLLEKLPKETEHALVLLQAQLKEVVRVAPGPAVEQLRKVPLWFSPEYPGVQASAEYHPEASWLRDHGRDPEMAQGVEFTNVRKFEEEVARMPVFVLHELSHAYHDRVVGFDQPEIKAAYDHAVASKLYEAVKRWHGPNRPETTERAYAMRDEKEYFAECSEAFFGRNDFFPFVRTELETHDPTMFKLLERIWTAPHSRAPAQK